MALSSYYSICCDQTNNEDIQSDNIKGYGSKIWQNFRLLLS